MAQTYARLTEAVAIFARYPGDDSIAAQHDELYAGPDPTLVSAEDLARLDVLGWFPNDRHACFQAFT